MGLISQVKIPSSNLCLDIEKAFLQIRIRESGRDCLRFHWVEATNNDKIDIFRFVRLVLGLTQPPFILDRTLDVHFNNSGQEFREVTEKVRDGVYVENLVTGAESIN